MFKCPASTPKTLIDKVIEPVENNFKQLLEAKLDEKPVANDLKIISGSELDGLKPIASVNFDLNVSALDEEARGIIIKSLPAIIDSDQQIILAGYTDSIGNKAYNDKLALRRAMSVSRYILGAGVQTDALALRGKGKCCYAASNDTESGRRANRRVEIFLKE